MSEINNERNSAPTGASEVVKEMKDNSKNPLGGATCCASSLNEVMGRNINESIKAGRYTHQSQIDECIKSQVVRTLKAFGLV